MMVENGLLSLPGLGRNLGFSCGSESLFSRNVFFLLRTWMGGGGRGGDVREADDLLGQSIAFLLELHLCEPSVRKGIGGRLILPAFS